MKTTSVMIVGVGGQGSLLASKLLGRLLVDEGYDVKVSEVHGMSQRGGSVVTYVRFGEKVYSPIVTDGEADLIVSFEKLEAARYAKYLKKDGRIVVNTQQIDPMPVIIGAAVYPENVLDELKAKGSKDTFEKVLKEVNDRDHADMTRAVAPLKQTKSHILVDTSDMTVEQVIAHMGAIVREKCKL